MEDPPSSKHTATVRCHNVRKIVCDGIGVDGAGQHKRVFEGESQCGSVGTCMSPIQGPHLCLSLTMVWSL